jgi:hypothetical protein
MSLLKRTKIDNKSESDLASIAQDIETDDISNMDSDDAQKTCDDTIPESKEEIEKILHTKEIYDYNIAKMFFKEHPEYAQKIIQIKSQKYRVSLRILDWFSTNYTKKNNVSYKVKIDGKEQYFDVHLSYDSQLKSYKKTRFDPFARRTKDRESLFIFKFPRTDKKIVTNIKQLNFLVWAFKYKIIDYVEENLDYLIGIMNTDNKCIKKSKNVKKEVRRKDTTSITSKSDFDDKEESLEISWD